MRSAKDTAGVVIPPPIVLLLALIAASILQWWKPWPIAPAGFPTLTVGVGLALVAIALAGWSIRTMRLAGTRFETSKPTSAIVAHGPFRFTRNPIYLAMMLLLFGFGLGLDSAWPLLVIAPFFLVIRYGVVAREEAYLARLFGDAYLDYKRSVRRWI